MYPKTYRFRRNEKFDRAKCGSNYKDFARSVHLPRGLLEFSPLVVESNFFLLFEKPKK